VANFEYVSRVIFQSTIPAGVEGAEIRFPKPDMIEEHDLVLLLKSRSDHPPHILIAAVSVGENNGNFS
jgi:hypothetical protein